MIFRRKKRKPKFERPQTAREELANSLTHGFALILALLGSMNLVVQATLHGSVLSLVAVNIFGASMIFLYASSTVYHAVTDPKLKHICRIVDHSTIYTLIAGTYTPVTLLLLPPAWGWSLFGVVWGLAIFGVIFKLFFTGKYDGISTAVYVLMGWMAIVALKPMLDHFPTGALWLIFAGGMSYTVGVIFYNWTKLPYHHTIWHVFVFGGTACHYFAVALYCII